MTLQFGYLLKLHNFSNVRALNFQPLTTLKFRKLEVKAINESFVTYNYAQFYEKHQEEKLKIMEDRMKEAKLKIIEANNGTEFDREERIRHLEQKQKEFEIFTEEFEVVEHEVECYRNMQVK